MKMELKLAEGLILALPQVGELFGIDNLKVIAKFAGRAAGKTKKYAADKKFKLREKINAIFFLGDLFEEGKEIDFKAVKDEYDDLSIFEREQLIELAVAEYQKALKEDETVDGEVIINKFLSIAVSASEWIAGGFKKAA